MRHAEIILQQVQPAISPVCFGYETDKPTHKYGPAMRPYWLLHYVVQGFGTYCLGGQVYTVKPSEIFVAPPDREIWYEGDPENTWDYIWVGFTLSGPVPPSLQRPVVACPSAGRIFEDMKACADRQEGRNHYLTAQIFRLFEVLSEQHQHRQTDYVRMALDCMENEYMQELNVGLLADRLGLDRCYFSTLFHRQTGMTPGQYLSNLRLTKAAAMLTEQGCPVSVAACSCGYRDPAVFSRAFKARFGVSPRSYCRNNT